jgi:hypothetical protein
MVRIQYNTQLNVKPRVLYIFTYWEFFVGIIIGGVPAFIFAILGKDPPLLDSIILFIFYSLVIGYYKVGKPEGYLGHYLTHLVTSEHFRPGKRKIYYPIRPDDMTEIFNGEKRTHSQLWGEAQKTQNLLIDAGIVPVGGIGIGQVIEVDTDDDNQLAVQGHAIEYVKKGGVIGVGDAYRELPHEDEVSLLVRTDNRIKPNRLSR